MRIIQIHNKYKTLGGEDVVVEREKNLLEAAGHEVVQYFVYNDEVNSLSEKLETAFGMPYSLKQKKRLKAFLLKNPANVIHVHNFLPILSPSIFYACKELSLPVVLTLHNYRLLCVNGLLYRNHHVCEDCVPKKIPLNGVVHGCYQDSRIASVFPAVSNGIHNALNTWNNKIDKIIFLTSFVREVFQRSAISFSSEKTAIKPNFVEDKGFSFEKDDYYLFVGRLSGEKGIDTVLEAFQKTKKKIIIAGEGPLSEQVIAASKKHPNILYRGFQDQAQLQALYKSSKALIFASKLYEGLPLVIIEAFSFGTPVITPNLGNAGNLITNNANGLKYKPGNSNSLLETVELFEQSDTKSFCREARKTFEEQFTAQENLKILLSIYNDAIAKNASF